MQDNKYFTLRACLVGLILSCLVVVMAHCSINIVHGSYLAIDHMPAVGIFLFFILVLLINPILGVWLLKTLILKYGGIKIFDRLRPFFLGLILGQYSVATFWFVIDLITGHTGNSVFWI